MFLAALFPPMLQWRGTNARILLSRVQLLLGAMHIAGKYGVLTFALQQILLANREKANADWIFLCFYPPIKGQNMDPPSQSQALSID